MIAVFYRDFYRATHHLIFQGALSGLLAIMLVQFFNDLSLVLKILH